MGERIPIKPPQIPYVDTSAGPLWSVMIPAYNCYEYLKEALQCVIRQDRGADSMQIEVIDDCSTDGDVEAMVKEIGEDRVLYYRQPENVGSLRNFETCINRAKGKLLHLLHGDDRIKPGFYEAMEKSFEQHPDAGAAFCRTSYIDINGQYMHTARPEADKPGILPDMLMLLGERQRIETPSIVVKRTVYEDLGAFRMLIYGEDWDMWIRIAAKYPIAYIPEPLAEYRMAIPSSITYKKMISAENIKDIETVMKLTREYFPEEQLPELHKKARKFYAAYAVRTANTLWHDKNSPEGAYAQLKAAVRLSRHPSIVLSASKVLFKMMIQYHNGRLFNKRDKQNGTGL
ncbi:glycosyltransferase family 2 protein [Foetidibacter luteolus]|uniref:glycosyltransferase family 2 protein n=1 Tax=Foetidibacter luteolus TaxID=2608880 RepID=UPI00129AC5A5|nr:glycosyltransferase [Foetidibacter luteolus]